MTVPNTKLLEAALEAQPKGGKRAFVRDLEANVDLINRMVGFGTSYDVILRRLRVAGVDCAVYAINGFFPMLVNIEMLLQLIRGEREGGEGSGRGTEDGGTRPDAVPVLRSILEQKLSYSQVSMCSDLDTAVRQLLSGPMIILVDGEASAIVVDTRDYPDRTPSAPNIEQVVHGPQDGFIENIIMNTALIRRRIRQPGLRLELQEVGWRGKTDIAVCWIEGLTDPELVSRVKRRLKDVAVDGIPMAEQPVAEILGGQPWNPFPTVRMTERPDVAATEILKGHVVVVVDTTPVALSVPVSLLQLVQNPEDYHVSPAFGTYLRWTEFVAIALAVLVPPVWLLLATHHGILAHFPALAFLGPKKAPNIPLALQFIMAEVAIDILRRAILNSPPGLATSFGILGAVIFGQVATKVGIFSPEALVYMVAAAVASFAISNVELQAASRLMRLSLLTLVWLWALPGLAVGLLFWLVLAARTDSLGLPYLWPLVPWNWPALRSVLIRESSLARAPRPNWLHPLNRWREARSR